MADYLYDNKDCFFYEVNQVADFIDCWNNKIPSKMKNLHLYLHGQNGAVTFCSDPEKNEFNDGETEITDVGMEMILNFLNKKSVINKAYLYSCNGGTLKEINVDVNDNQRGYLSQYTFAQSKYADDFSNKSKCSAAMAFAYKISPTKIEACKNDQVDYYNFSLAEFSLNPAMRELAADALSEYGIDPRFAGSGPQSIIIFNYTEHSSEYKKIYYPVRHYAILNIFKSEENDGKWINVSFENNEFKEEIVGDNRTE